MSINPAVESGGGASCAVASRGPASATSATANTKPLHLMPSLLELAFPLLLDRRKRFAVELARHGHQVAFAIEVDGHEVRQVAALLAEGADPFQQELARVDDARIRRLGARRRLDPVVHEEERAPGPAAVGLVRELARVMERVGRLLHDVERGVAPGNALA